jgi:hypothetical protein
MRTIGRIFLLIAWALGAITASAQSPQTSIEPVRQSVADAYKAKTMRTLDDKKLIQGTLVVRIVHSLMEGKGSVVRRSFKSFAQFEAWLKKGEREEGAPFRQVSELVKCSSGHCKYNYDGGILHNQLYLHDIYYQFCQGKPYITRIDLLDGD